MFPLFLDFNDYRLVPGLMVTASVDKSVTLWDTQNASVPSPPHPCGSKHMAVGKLYTVNFYPSSPWLLGCAGGGKEVALWDLTREAPIQKRFGDRVAVKTPVDDNSPKEVEEKTEEKQEAFDAMMNAPKQEEAVESPIQKKVKNKKKLGSGKKKAHRVSR
jgi:hypothetical protein